MPCYEVQTISVELKTADKDLLFAAIKALGLTYTEQGTRIVIHTTSGDITLTNGVASFTNNNCQKIVNDIKQMYSTKTIERLAKKYKFTITTKVNNEIVLRRY